MITTDVILTTVIVIANGGHWVLLSGQLALIKTFYGKDIIGYR
jgi:hypothetical protein